MRRASLTICVALIVLAGCAAEPLPSAAQPTPIDFGPLAVVDADWNGDKARTEGFLEITDSCVFLRMRDGSRVLLAWPRATRWAHGQVAFTDVDGESFMLSDGQHTAFGGSGGSTEAVLESVDWLAPPRPECRVPGIWGVGGLASL